MPRGRKPRKPKVLTLVYVLRLQHKMSQRELGGKIGYDQAKISKMEYFKFEPSMDKLKQIAQILHYKGNPMNLLLPYTDRNDGLQK